MIHKSFSKVSQVACSCVDSISEHDMLSASTNNDNTAITTVYKTCLSTKCPGHC